MKKLQILLAASALIVLSGCEVTVDTQYPDYTVEAQPELVWELNKETGSYEHKEDVNYKIIVKEKAYKLPDFES